MKNHFSISGTSIKLIAVIAMLIDHVGILFFPHDLLWRVVGKISFPLFAFLVAEGSGRTSNTRNYLFRLFGFAVLSHIPYELFTDAVGGTTPDFNIFFTLSAGLIAIMLWNRLPLASSIPSIAILCSLAEYLSFDYGAYGVLTVLLSRLVLCRRKWGLTTLLLFPQGITIFRSLLGIASIQLFASMSVPIIASYNGERGPRLPRSIFYGFYPVHLLILLCVKNLI